MFSGSGDRFYTPMLQVPPGQRCPRQEMFGCVHYPLHKLQRQDEEKGLSFYFELNVYNMAEHFTTVRSDTFTLPSRFVPGHGSVVDIDPSTYSTITLAKENVLMDNVHDIKVHFVANILCAAWSGFYHHQNVTFQVGIGTTDTTDNVIPFVSISTDNNSHCFNSSKLLKGIQYFFLVKATCSAGSITVSSNGVTILDKSQAVNDINLYVGSTCEYALSELLGANPNITSDKVVFNSSRRLDIGHVYTLEIVPGLGRDIDIWSDDVIWLEDTRHTGAYIRREFRTITDYPTFVVLQNRKRSLNNSTTVNILNCGQRILAHSSAQTLSAFWTIQPPVRELVDSLYVSLIRNFCKETNSSKSSKDWSTEITRERWTPTDHNVTFSHLSLIDKTYYSVEIQACFGKSCLPSACSRPVLVQYLPPSVSITEASILSIGDDCLDLNIKWKPSDCLSHGNTTPAAIYQWTVTLGDNAESPLTPWFPVGQHNITKQYQDILRVRYY